MDETALTKVALVTGAGRGIGAAIAKRLARAGIAVAVNYRTDESSAMEVVSEITAQGGISQPFMADVSDMAELRALVAAVFSWRGRLDILINNAATIEVAALDSITEVEFDRQFQTNVKSTVFAIQGACRYFRDNEGSIVNISSINARRPAATAAVYSASKAAVEAMTVAFAAELGPRGIRVNCIAPGTTKTDMLRGALTPEFEAILVAKTALGRLGDPSDIADVAAFLVSDAARWITGETITVSGGLRA